MIRRSATDDISRGGCERVVYGSAWSPASSPCSLRSGSPITSGPGRSARPTPGRIGRDRRVAAPMPSPRRQCIAAGRPVIIEGLRRFARLLRRRDAPDLDSTRRRPADQRHRVRRRARRTSSTAAGTTRSSRVGADAGARVARHDVRRRRRATARSCTSCSASSRLDGEAATCSTGSTAPCDREPTTGHRTAVQRDLGRFARGGDPAAPRRLARPALPDPRHETGRDVRARLIGPTCRSVRRCAARGAGRDLPGRSADARPTSFRRLSQRPQRYVGAAGRRRPLHPVRSGRTRWKPTTPTSRSRSALPGLPRRT